MRCVPSANALMPAVFRSSRPVRSVFPSLAVQVLDDASMLPAVPMLISRSYPLRLMRS